MFSTAPAYSLKGPGTSRQYLSAEHAKIDNMGNDSPGPKYRYGSPDLPGSPSYTIATKAGSGNFIQHTTSPGPKYKMFEVRRSAR